MTFISFEGIDQSGKSTQLRLLADSLTKSGIDVVSVREPGGTLLGEQIRELLLGPVHAGMDDWAEALLYAAARAQLVREVIRPALKQGRTVLSDRYLDSSLVYQGLARGLALERILDLNLWATDSLLPDLTFIIHLGVDASRQRLSGRATAEDRIESEALGFHQQVEAGYRELEALYPERIVALDGHGTIDELHARILAAGRERFGWEV